MHKYVLQSPLFKKKLQLKKKSICPAVFVKGSSKKDKFFQLKQYNFCCCFSAFSLRKVDFPVL